MGHCANKQPPNQPVGPDSVSLCQSVVSVPVLPVGSRSGGNIARSACYTPVHMFAGRCRRSLQGWVHGGPERPDRCRCAHTSECAAADCDSIKEHRHQAVSHVSYQCYRAVHLLGKPCHGILNRAYSSCPLYMPLQRSCTSWQRVLQAKLCCQSTCESFVHVRKGLEQHTIVNTGMKPACLDSYHCCRLSIAALHMEAAPS